MRSTRSAVAAVALACGAGVASSSVTVAAAADEKRACVDAFERGQQLRSDGKPGEARPQLLVCARDVCPAPVRKDCTSWLAELDAAQPSVVIIVRDASGHDLVDVNVIVDGQQLATRLDGRAMLVDPGLHTFRLEAAGQPPIEQAILVHEGEKNRVINFTTGAASGGGARAVDGAQAVGGGAPAGEGAGGVEGARRGHGIAPWIVFGVGAAVALVGIPLYVAGASKKSEGEADARSLHCGEVGYKETPTSPPLEPGHCPPSVTAAQVKAFNDKVDGGAAMGEVGFFMIVGGSAVAVAGLVWHLLEPTGPAAKSPAGGRLRPVFAPGYTGVNFSSAF